MMKVVDERFEVCSACERVMVECGCELSCWCCGGELGECDCESHAPRWRVEREGDEKRIVSCHGHECVIEGPAGAELVRELVQHAEVRDGLEKLGVRCSLVPASGLRAESVIVLSVLARD